MDKKVGTFPTKPQAIQSGVEQVVGPLELLNVLIGQGAEFVASFHGYGFAHVHEVDEDSCSQPELGGLALRFHAHYEAAAWGKLS